MTKVYTFPEGIGKEPVQQEFTLVELMHGIPNHNNEMVQEGECYVTGVRFVLRGTPDYDMAIENTRRLLAELEYTTEKIDAGVSSLLQRETLRLDTNFHAAKYHHLDGCPYKGFITDMKFVAIIHFDTREIAIVPFGDPKTGPHRNLFYDVKGAKLSGSRWQYNGSMADALREFHDFCYSFREGRHPLGTRDLIDFGLLRKPADRKYITIRSEVKLEDALSLLA